MTDAGPEGAGLRRSPAPGDDRAPVTLSSRLVPGRRSALALLTLMALAVACDGVASPDDDPSADTATPTAPLADPEAGIMNLDHLIFIVQENRSFDHYFGTYPGADGIPMGPDGKPSVCVPDPLEQRCLRPFHSSRLVNRGGTHSHRASVVSVNGGKMDGFIRSLYWNCIRVKKGVDCLRPPKSGRPDVMSYHDRREIPNYWRYADEFVLQDRMFAPTDSWTLPAHLYLVSGWSARCEDPYDPMSCRSELVFPERWHL